MKHHEHYELDSTDESWDWKGFLAAILFIGCTNGTVILLFLLLKWLGLTNGPH